MYVPLDEPAFAAFRDFAATAYPNSPLTAAVREAILLFMGTEPLEAARSAARRAAWLEARIQVATLIGGVMKQAADAFRMSSESAQTELHEMATNGLLDNQQRAA